MKYNSELDSMKIMNSLNNYKKNNYSQNGEDGILEELLQRLQKEINLNKWCVEFGAWDGIHLSNTFNLIKNYNYKAVLIEGDKERHKELCLNIPSSDVHKICRFVTLDGDSTLDNILASTLIPLDFDVLSIDIDGCDYYILKSLKKYRPRVICIEYNPTIPNDVYYVQKADFTVKQGASALAIVELAEEMGYGLVALTDCNLILARKEFVKYVLGDAQPSLNDLRDDGNIKTYIFSGYDGTILSNKEIITANWHSYSVPISKIQIIPKALRKYSGDYCTFQKICFAIYVLIKDRKKFMELFKSRMSKTVG